MEIMTNAYGAFSATLVGNVQNKGFRTIVKDSGNEHHLNGEVFNNPDRTVTIYYGGSNGNISGFLEDIKAKGAESDIIFEITESIELPEKMRLPNGFYIIDTDTIQDKERKFDIAIELVRDINKKLGKLDPIDMKLEKLDSIKSNISILPGKLDSVDMKLAKLDSIETLLVSMNDILKKIAEK